MTDKSFGSLSHAWLLAHAMKGKLEGARVLPKPESKLRQAIRKDSSLG